jgi:hypothetical protein
MITLVNEVGLLFTESNCVVDSAERLLIGLSCLFCFQRYIVFLQAFAFISARGCNIVIINACVRNSCREWNIIYYFNKKLPFQLSYISRREADLYQSEGPIKKYIYIVQKK